MEIKEAIRTIVASQNLRHEDAHHVADEIMSGNVTDAQIAALLVALRLKGETIDEITGFAEAMREKATPIQCDADCIIDTCGTGGDQSNTFNISTLSAIVAAGAGCKVAKHGNRSVSSRCGSADLLIELGVNVEMSPEDVSRCIDEIGIGFLFAPSLHKAMRYAIGPRREIGIRTIFNILGPLTNPAGAKRQLLGVFDGDLTELLARVLMKLGSEHVLVVHGEDGLDEITLTDKTRVSELRNGKIKNYFLKPERFHFDRVKLEKIRGGEPAENARIALDVLHGVHGAARDLVIFNAGASVYVSGLSESIEKGIQLSRESIDSGKALEKLEALKKMTHS